MSDLKFVVVETEHGLVKGDRRSTVLGMDFINFQGIPYMKAPKGELRFKAPQAPEKWNEPFDATLDCPSFPNFDIMAKKAIGQEDAGCINVFTKSTTPNKLYPVMAYIHGGGFQLGSSSPMMYGPDYILQKEVVFVSFNYRVGAFGFLSLDDPALDVPGNAGLKDQTMALKWIKNNIRNFGGDPNNVTLFGTSAGGASVHYHLISEQSKGLFQRAIAMSGTTFNSNWAFHPRRNEAERIAKTCGYDGEENEGSILNFLNNIDAFKIVDAAENILTPEEKYGEQTVFSMGPVLEPYVAENTFVPKDPVLMAREAWSKDIDVIFGVTSNEGLLMALFPLEEFISKLQNSAYFTPLLDLKLKPEDAKAIKFGEKLKRIYYGSHMTPSKSNKAGYFAYSGDMQFLHGMQRAILSRIASNGSGKTFMYRFDILTELNVIKNVLLQCKDEPGTEHGGCISYIFKNILAPSPPLDSIEFTNIKKVVEILTNFAIIGNPNIYGKDDWKAIASADLPLKCYNLTKDECTFIDFPESDRLAVWDSIYTEAKVDLY